MNGVSRVLPDHPNPRPREDEMRSHTPGGITPSPKDFLGRLA